MALLTTYTDANKVEDTTLQIVYTRRKIYGSWSSSSLSVTTTHTQAWEYTRRASQSYRYVGMTKSAAEACAAALVALYTRATKVSEWDTTEGSLTYGQFKHVAGGDVPMADVTPQHDGGEMWSVVVNLHEEDSRTSLSASESFSSLFSAENNRIYSLGDLEA